MIPFALRITLCVAVICYFVIILYYLKKKMLELKYTLLWLVAGLVMGIMIFFPELLVWFVRILGIETSCDETAIAIVENGDKILSNTKKIAKTKAVQRTKRQ